MEPRSTVKINSFEPLQVELPEKLIIPLRLILPTLKIKLYDLSMGGLLPGAAIVSDGQFFSLDMTGEEGTELELGKFMEFVRKSLPQLKEMHKLAQEKMNEKALL